MSTSTDTLAIKPTVKPLVLPSAIFDRIRALGVKIPTAGANPNALYAVRAIRHIDQCLGTMEDDAPAGYTEGEPSTLGGATSEELVSPLRAIRGRWVAVLNALGEVGRPNIPGMDWADPSQSSIQHLLRVLEAPTRRMTLDIWGIPRGGGLPPATVEEAEERLGRVHDALRDLAERREEFNADSVRYCERDLKRMVGVLKGQKAKLGIEFTSTALKGPSAKALAKKATRRAEDAKKRLAMKGRAK